MRIVAFWFDSPPLGDKLICASLAPSFLFALTLRRKGGDSICLFRRLVVVDRPDRIRGFNLNTRGVSADHGENSEPRPGSAGHLFILLWDTLADILGTAATATLVARALKRAAPSTPLLAELFITTKNFSYEYRLPESWRGPENAAAVAAFDRLLEQLVPLLITLTGQVVVRHIARLEPFSARALPVGEEPPS